MFHQLVLLTAICITSTVSADTAYRLNTPIVPQSYAVQITPYFDTGNAVAFTFDGEVTIVFQTEQVTNQIKLHSEDLNFTASDIVLTAGNTNVPLHTVTPLEFDEKYTFVFINLQNDLQIGNTYTLKIGYRGPIRKDLNGFYRNYYYENGVKKWLGATQMEPTHARKVFPCFDEPGLKATFTLAIDRPENFKETRANTKIQTSVSLGNGYIRDIFYPTPIMSTYLVAFLVSEFEGAYYSSNGTREFGIFVRPEAKNQSYYAFEFGQRVVEALGGYFGIDYYQVNPNLKLDHVALLDFRAGAMENWGLITYRESLLLYVPEESTPYYKYRVAQIVAHETTHMWFGNLVTCHWWSDTWLNEGFANYFQDYMTSLIEPEVGAGDILVTGSVYAAYDADSSADSPPISNDDVNSPAEISGHFGTITYQKAGSVIRMMHHMIGDDAFILGLHVYLNANSFKPGYPQALYAALDEGVTSSKALDEYPGVNFTDVMDSWISQAGHPILNVHVNYTTGVVTLTQKRFYTNSSQTESNEVYKIPITYTTESTMNFNSTKPAFIMEDETHTFQIANLSHDWVIFNLQESGLYRVNYDDESWEHIAAALKGYQREKIHHLNRAKIVNDLFALYQADYVSFSRLKDVFEFLEQETDYSVWYAAIRGLNKLRNAYLGTDTQNPIESYINELTTSVITKLGYEALSSEGTVALRNRMQVLELACKAGHSGCIQFTIQKFKQLKEEGVEISPSLRPVSYCYGLKHGDDQDYDFLWDRMMKTNVANEKAVILDALGCTSSEVKLKEYLYAAQKEDSPIRTQDLTAPLASILAHYENVNLVLDELKINYDVWSDLYTTMDTVLAAIASALHTESHLNGFDSWLSLCNKCTEESLTAARTALTSARATASWAQAHKDDIEKNLKNVSAQMLPSALLLIVALTANLWLRL